MLPLIAMPFFSAPISYICFGCHSNSHAQVPNWSSLTQHQALLLCFCMVWDGSKSGLKLGEVGRTLRRDQTDWLWDTCLWEWLISKGTNSMWRSSRGIQEVGMALGRAPGAWTQMPTCHQGCFLLCGFCGTWAEWKVFIYSFQTKWNKKSLVRFMAAIVSCHHFVSRAICCQLPVVDLNQYSAVNSLYIHCVN